MGELVLELVRVFGLLCSAGEFLSEGYWFIRYGYAKLKARWRVSRGWTAAFLALWFVSASFALARSDLNRLLYLKAQGIPNLMAGISSLGYQISEKRLTPYQESGLWEFHLSTTGQEPWIVFVVYFPPFKPIEQWSRTDGSKLDLKCSTGSARLHYEWTPNKPDPAPTAFWKRRTGCMQSLPLRPSRNTLSGIMTATLSVDDRIFLTFSRKIHCLLGIPYQIMETKVIDGSSSVNAREELEGWRVPVRDRLEEGVNRLDALGGQRLAVSSRAVLTNRGASDFTDLLARLRTQGSGHRVLSRPDA